MTTLGMARQRSATAILNTYGERRLVLVRGNGMEVWDSEGRSYLDFLGGIAVNCLGHAHPRLCETIAEQARTIMHTSNLYYIEPQLQLAGKLHQLAGSGKCFFCNSGAEANEAAFKLARKFGKTKEGQPFEIICAQSSFHGRTLATIAATGTPKYQKPFLPMPDGYRFVPYDDLAALQQAVSSRTVAVILEVIQGEGGVRAASPDYLQRVAALCHERDILLIFDEVQTGIGRTGHWFAWQMADVRPDLFTLAKGLGGGFPIGALVCLRDDLDFAPGEHASTFGGNHLASAAALATLETIEMEHLLENTRKRGGQLNSGLRELAQQYPQLIRSVRGAGLLQGVELAVPGAGFVVQAEKRGFLINCTADTVLRFAPPLIVSQEDITQLLAMLGQLFHDHKEKQQ